MTVPWWVQVLLYTGAAVLGLWTASKLERLNVLCLIGDHHWGLWQCDTTPVPLFKVIGDKQQQVGWQYVTLTGPSYRRCQHCPALQRRP
jgi:hypothetical protein